MPNQTYSSQQTQNSFAYQSPASLWIPMVVVGISAASFVFSLLHADRLRRQARARRAEFRTLAGSVASGMEGRTCPRCSAVMVQGELKGKWRVCWLPEKRGPLASVRAPFPVTAYCCAGCGTLDLAAPEAAARAPA